VTDQELVQTAIAASKNAHAPYSHFQVGAALLLADDTVILGCNVENASFGLTNCAERTALFAAIAQGRRDFARMAIFVDHPDFISPCGACRQVLHELAPDIDVILARRDGQTKVIPVRDLLPFAFSSDDLRK
jgi:cytidine deaminase